MASAMIGHQSDELNPRFLKIASACFYAAASFLIVIVNKVVLTTYKFPSFQALGLGQMIASLIILYTSKKLKLISFPAVTWETSKKVWPIPIFYFGNLFLGLGGTQKLSLPMFVVLRRFSILFTMIGEGLILKVRASIYVQLSVYMMIFGALIAALQDLAFDMVGYLFVFLNNLCTAGNGIMLKKKLDAKELGKYGLLFFNVLLMLPPSLLLAWFTNDISLAIQYEGWGNPLFLFSFLASSCTGFLLMLSIILCTHYNSALTTTIVGCLKNIFSTYVGMYIGGDYIFSWKNFIGLNISVVGSLFYSYLVFRQQDGKVKYKSTPPSTSSSSTSTSTPPPVSPSHHNHHPANDKINASISLSSLPQPPTTLPISHGNLMVKPVENV